MTPSLEEFYSDTSELFQIHGLKSASSYFHGEIPSRITSLNYYNETLMTTGGLRRAGREFPWVKHGSKTVAMMQLVFRSLSLLMLAGLLAVDAASLDAAGTEPLRTELGDAPLTPDLGGGMTSADFGDHAFTFPAPNSPAERRKDFAFGARLFDIKWAAFPSPVKIFDGLGPTFNRDQCSGCHQRNGRGRPPATEGGAMDTMLVRLSVTLPDGTTAPHPAYGDQLNDNAIPSVPAEGRAIIAYDEVGGAYADGTPYTLLRPRLRFANLAYGGLEDALVSPRVAPALIGLGLLESVPQSTLTALADPDDADGDGISGRINWLDGPDGKPVAGRFGWKANVVDLQHQAAGAAHGDMGLTTTLYPDQNCPPAQAACAAAGHEASPEISDPFLDRIVTYVRTLAVPAERNAGDKEVVAGYDAFRRFGCAGCHLPTLKTDNTAALPELQDQTFHPFTDLLLHDMGDGLADGRPDGSATGSEWRTPPLWGLGLVPTVNGHARLLHDGRARGFAEAILWHGGEAAAAKEAFRTADKADRDALVAFLRSL